MLALQLDSSLQDGKYIIKEVLGQGGFGISYLAEHTLLGTKVAIKEFFFKQFCDREEATSHVTLGTQSAHDEVLRYQEKFLKEARIIAKLNHPNIVKVHDIFKENNTAYYVMDYIEGETLFDLAKRCGPLPEAEALEYILQAGDALAYLHEQHLNHLDVKPGNLMLRKADNKVILIDFGMSKQYDSVSGNQTSTTPVGISHGYAPIEQYKEGGVKEFSPETDIYALGATLYKLLTGITPPQATDIVSEGWEPEYPLGVSEVVKSAIAKAMEVRKPNRYHSVNDFLSALNFEDKPSEKVSTSVDSQPSCESVQGFAQTVSVASVEDDDETKLTINQQELEEKRREEEIQRIEEEERRRAAAEDAQRKIAAAEKQRKYADEEQKCKEDQKSKIVFCPENNVQNRMNKKKLIYSILGVAVIALVAFIIFRDGRSYYEKASDYYNNKEYSKAFDCLLEGDKLGEPLSTNMLGTMYQDGLGVVCDSCKAFACYNKAASLGCGKAEINLGNCYMRGFGTSANFEEGFSHYKKAFDLGTLDAALHLADCYSRGKGVDLDLSMAQQYLLKAKEAGSDNKLIELVQSNLDYQIAAQEAKKKATSLLSSVTTLSDEEEVDLGLSVIWANHNVGSSTAYGFGQLFMYGDPTGTKKFSDGFPKTAITGTDFDIAKVNWGGPWRLPTKAECQELIDKCAFEAVSIDGINGMQIVGSTGNCIFLPAAGRTYDYGRSLKNDVGNYLTGDVEMAYSEVCGVALHFDFSEHPEGYLDFEQVGWNCSVRPVRDR